MFLVRVELHDADEGENTYDHLHEQMKAASFDKTIMVAGTKKKLPTAEYTYEKAGATKQSVYKLAQIAASKAITDAGLSSVPGIVVAEVVGDLWVGGLEDAD
jgi:hypothetical protein